MLLTLLDWNTDPPTPSDQPRPRRPEAEPTKHPMEEPISPPPPLPQPPPPETPQPPPISA